MFISQICTDHRNKWYCKFVWFNLAMLQIKKSRGRNPGLVVIGGGSCSKGHGFESQDRILDRHTFIFNLTLKFVVFVWKDENIWKRGWGWPIFKKQSNKFYSIDPWPPVLQLCPTTSCDMTDPKTLLRLLLSEAISANVMAWTTSRDLMLTRARPREVPASRTGPGLKISSATWFWKENSLNVSSPVVQLGAATASANVS